MPKRSVVQCNATDASQQWHTQIHAKEKHGKNHQKKRERSGATEKTVPRAGSNESENKAMKSAPSDESCSIAYHC